MVHGRGSDYYTDQQVEAWADKDESDGPPIEDEQQYLVVAEQNGIIVGFGQLSLENDEIVAVYVHPDYVRQGVGSVLLSHLESRANDAGIGELTLSASLPGVPLYDQAGYERMKTIVHETTGGVGLDCIAMRKRISNWRE